MKITNSKENLILHRNTKILPFFFREQKVCILTLTYDNNGCYSISPIT